MGTLEKKDLSGEILEDEIEKLMELYGGDVLRTAYMYLKDLQRAEDIFQEVFYRAYLKYATFQHKSSVKTWLIRITINLCKDYLRSSWFKRTFFSDEIIVQDRSFSVEEKIAKKAENEILFKAILNLKPAFKDVIILYYYHECSTKEISDILHIAEGTVRSRLYRARNDLKIELEGRIGLSGSAEEF